MTINQDFLDEFDKFLPVINKAEEEHESITMPFGMTNLACSFANMINSVPAMTSNASNIPASTMTKKDLDDATALLDKPISLSLTPTYNYQVNMEDIIADEMATQIRDEIDKQLIDSICATASQSLSVGHNLAYDVIDNNHINYNHNYNSLAAEADMHSGVYFTAANPIPPSIQIIGDNGSSVEVKSDGTVTISGDVEMDEISCKFWDAISYRAPENKGTIEHLEEEVKELTSVNTFLESVAADQKNVIADLKARLQYYEVEKSEESCKNQIAFDFEATRPRTALSALENLEYFQRKVAKSVAIPSDMMKAMRQTELAKAQLSLASSFVIDKKDLGGMILPKEIAKALEKEADTVPKKSAFDDAMELVK